MMIVLVIWFGECSAARPGRRELLSFQPRCGRRWSDHLGVARLGRDLDQEGGDMVLVREGFWRQRRHVGELAREIFLAQFVDPPSCEMRLIRPQAFLVRLKIQASRSFQRVADQCQPP